MSTPFENVNRIRELWQGKAISREAAITQIMQSVNVTRLGAADLLTHPLSPEQRLKVG